MSNKNDVQDLSLTTAKLNEVKEFFKNTTMTKTIMKKYYVDEDDDEENTTMTKTMTKKNTTMLKTMMKKILR